MKKQESPFDPFKSYNDEQAKKIQDLLPKLEEVKDRCVCGHSKSFHTDAFAFDPVGVCGGDIDTVNWDSKCRCIKFQLDNFWYIEHKQKP